LLESVDDRNPRSPNPYYGNKENPLVLYYVSNRGKEFQLELGRLRPVKPVVGSLANLPILMSENEPFAILLMRAK
jgi:hypothetical protein